MLGLKFNHVSKMGQCCYHLTYQYTGNSNAISFIIRSNVYHMEELSRTHNRHSNNKLRKCSWMLFFLTPYMPKCFEDTLKYIYYILLLFFRHRDGAGCWNPSSWKTKRSSSYSQYHGVWWSGDTGSQDISRHSVAWLPTGDKPLTHWPLADAAMILN